MSRTRRQRHNNKDRVIIISSCSHVYVCVVGTDKSVSSLLYITLGNWNMNLPARLVWLPADE